MFYLPRTIRRLTTYSFSTTLSYSKRKEWGIADTGTWTMDCSDSSFFCVMTPPPPPEIIRSADLESEIRLR